jgi:hypothetical protein
MDLSNKFKSSFGFSVVLLVLATLIVLSMGCEDDLTENVEFEGTLLSGELSGTLSLLDSPFVVSENIFVDSLASLTIEAGVRLSFRDSTSFKIYGELLSHGTKEAPIIYTNQDSLWYGITILNQEQTAEFSFCIFENIVIDDYSYSEYGSVVVMTSTVEFNNCIFQNNSSKNGGALSFISSTVEVKNCIFDSNQAVVFGGAIISIESNAVYHNNTFYKNSTVNFGGGLVILDPVSEEIQNNIFYLNTGNTGDPGISIMSGDSLCTTEYNYLSWGSMDPLFRSEGNFSLQLISPCIDNGNPAVIFNDIDGSRNDQGAYGGPGGDW